MSASPFARQTTPPRSERFDRAEHLFERTSDAPIALDLSSDTGNSTLPRSWGGWASKIPQSWIGMSGYLIAGVFLGLVLIVALSLTRGDASSKSAASAGIVTDNVVHLSAKEIGDSCWRGAAKDGPARVTVSLEVGLDGKVRNAIASGESPVMRGCVESHVKAWEFLPQANPSQMVLPFEIGH